MKKRASTIAPALSEDAIAETFVTCHGASWRYVPLWRKWLHWNGIQWTRDTVALIRDEVRLACREAAAATDQPTVARKLASERTLSAVLRLVQSDRRIASSPEDWDRSDMVLNTLKGAIDLTTGQFLGSAQTLCITNTTAASPQGSCPSWFSFLDRITGRDAELQAYLKRLSGYCLTGRTSEHALAFLHGTGANGKSVFLNTIVAVMGTYAATAALETFIASRQQRHLTELAGLHAARLVVVSETDGNRAWAEARIKAVTGGETIRANFMCTDHFEFAAQFKLIVVGNRIPSLTNVGEAMRRRLHLVPFDVTIPEDERDPHLTEKLLAERDGILRWMIDGCLEWQEAGLAPPRRIRDAGAMYFRDEDLVGQWIDDCCTIDPDAKATSHDLFNSWSVWARAHGAPTGSTKALGASLRERQFADAKVGGKRGWTGVSLRNHSEGDAQ